MKIKHDNLGKKLLVLLLFGVLIATQVSLWLAPGVVVTWLDTRARNVAQLTENKRLSDTNTRLSSEISALKGGRDMIEELAREELDMVREDEIFFRFVRAPVSLQKVP